MSVRAYAMPARRTKAACIMMDGSREKIELQSNVATQGLGNLRFK